MTTNGKCLKWLNSQMKKSKVELIRAMIQKDKKETANLKEIIDILDHLIQLVSKGD